MPSRALPDHEEALFGGVIIGLGAGEAEGVRDGFHWNEEFTAETQRSQRDAELRWEIVDKAFNAIREADSVEIHKES